MNSCGGVDGCGDVGFESRFGKDALCSTGSFEFKSELACANGDKVVELDSPR